MSGSNLTQDEEDVFFDSYDYVHTPSDPALPEEAMGGCTETKLRVLEYELWTRELMSIDERRRIFLSGMGFDNFTSVGPGCSPTPEETVGNGLEVMFPSCDEEHDCSNWQNGLFTCGLERLKPSLNSKSSTDLYTVQKTLGKRVDEQHNVSLDSRNNKSRRWWRSLTTCKYGVSVKVGKVSPDTNLEKVRHSSKRCKGFGALHLGQEIQAHKGIIRAMKFSPSGSYLASSGEDCVVRIWKVGDASFKCLNADGDNFRYADDVEGGILKFSRKVSDSSADAVIAEKDFKIVQVLLQEFHGHSSDILDLCWSKSNYLLSSSKDKTVRLWKVGSQGCLRVFQHNDYVTCIQFNPANDQYFISGSIDGKVRMWGVAENHVVDWVDNRDIVTAVCYQPDGEGIVVGSIEGSCEIYSYSGGNLELDRKLCVHSQKKSSRKRITGLQFAPDNPQNLLITSADSTVHFSDGTNVKKFWGPQKSRGQTSVSFTPNGNDIISVDKDSQVYIWKNEKSKSISSRGIKLTCPCNTFHSEGVSVVAPWPGMGPTIENMTKNSLKSSLEQNHIDQSTCLKDHDRFSLSACFFPDLLCTSVTWPEEILQDENLHHHQHQCLKKPSALVVVTASYDGIIRSFLNHS